MKKKFLLTLLAITCALCCAFSVIACDNDSPDNSGGGSTDAAQVTAEKWAQNFDGTIVNYTATITMANVPFQTTEVADGKVKMSQSMGESTAIRIFTKDGDNYYRYTNNADKWTKVAEEKNNYDMIYASQASGVTCFKDDFSAFTYANGVYTAATLDKTATVGGTLNNVEITFKDDKAVSIKFNTVMNNYDIKYEISKIGSTTVDLPSEFTEQIEANFYMIERSSTGWVPEQSAAISFTGNGTCYMEEPGTYEVKDGVIEVTFDEITYYAVIDGKILWMFQSKEDAADISKAIQHFYRGVEISAEDNAKIVAVFGDGVREEDNDKEE